jgi:5-methylcytosine-specific restriction endonuclease McrA
VNTDITGVFRGTWREAKEAGVSKFFTGRPCKHGHLTFRRVSANGGCALCIDIRAKEWRKGKTDRNAYKRVIRWRAKNKTRWVVQRRAYKARKRGADGSYTADDIRILQKQQKHKCANKKCAKDIRRKFHIDHKHPLVKGGSNWRSNLQLLCPKCNLSKGSKLITE